MGLVPFGVAVGFTEGWPRRGAEPRPHRYRVMLPPAQRGPPWPGPDVSLAGPTNSRDACPSLGNKIKKRNQRQTPGLTVTLRPSAAGWEAVAPPPAAKRERWSRARSCVGRAGGGGLMWMSAGRISRCNRCQPRGRSHGAAFGERLRSSASQARS